MAGTVEKRLLPVSAFKGPAASLVGALLVLSVGGQAAAVSLRRRHPCYLTLDKEGILVQSQVSELGKALCTLPCASRQCEFNLRRHGTTVKLAELFLDS